MPDSAHITTPHNSLPNNTYQYPSNRIQLPNNVDTPSPEDLIRRVLVLEESNKNIQAERDSLQQNHAILLQEYGCCKEGIAKLRKYIESLEGKSHICPETCHQSAQTSSPLHLKVGESGAPGLSSDRLLLQLVKAETALERERRRVDELEEELRRRRLGATTAGDPGGGQGFKKSYCDPEGPDLPTPSPFHWPTPPRPTLLEVAELEAARKEAAHLRGKLTRVERERDSLENERDAAAAAMQRLRKQHSAAMERMAAEMGKLTAKLSIQAGTIEAFRRKNEALGHQLETLKKRARKTWIPKLKPLGDPQPGCGVGDMPAAGEALVDPPAIHRMDGQVYGAAGGATAGGAAASHAAHVGAAEGGAGETPVGRVEREELRDGLTDSQWKLVMLSEEVMHLAYTLSARISQHGSGSLCGIDDLCENLGEGTPGSTIGSSRPDPIKGSAAGHGTSNIQSNVTIRDDLLALVQFINSLDVRQLSDEELSQHVRYLAEQMERLEGEAEAMAAAATTAAATTTTDKVDLSPEIRYDEAAPNPSASASASDYFSPLLSLVPPPLPPSLSSQPPPYLSFSRDLDAVGGRRSTAVSFSDAPTLAEHPSVTGLSADTNTEPTLHESAVFDSACVVQEQKIQDSPRENPDPSSPPSICQTVSYDHLPTSQPNVEEETLRGSGIDPPPPSFVTVVPDSGSPALPYIPGSNSGGYIAQPPPAQFCVAAPAPAEAYPGATDNSTVQLTCQQLPWTSSEARREGVHVAGHGEGVSCGEDVAAAAAQWKLSGGTGGLSTLNNKDSGGSPDRSAPTVSFGSDLHAEDLEISTAPSLSAMRRRIEKLQARESTASLYAELSARPGPGPSAEAQATGHAVCAASLSAAFENASRSDPYALPPSASESAIETEDPRAMALDTVVAGGGGEQGRMVLVKGEDTHTVGGPLLPPVRRSAVSEAGEGAAVIEGILSGEAFPFSSGVTSQRQEGAPSLRPVDATAGEEGAPQRGVDEDSIMSSSAVDGADDGAAAGQRKRGFWGWILGSG